MSDPRRRRLSYTAAFKLKAVKAVEETSNLEVARSFEVDESNVRRWRKDSRLLACPIQNAQKEGTKLDNSQKWTC